MGRGPWPGVSNAGASAQVKGCGNARSGLTETFFVGVL